MNYLAHIYLSGDNEDVMLGNFMADGIKGKQYEAYPEQIKAGILLHRHIDTFTDFHPIVNETKLLFRPKYGRYAPILIDILYDHFLAANWLNYHQKPLKIFVDEVYQTFKRRWDDLTPRIQHMLPYMMEHNWLYNYSNEEGIKRVLMGMSRRVPKGGVLKGGWDDLIPIYDEVGEHFERFFTALEKSANVKLLELMA